MQPFQPRVWPARPLPSPLPAAKVHQFQQPTRPVASVSHSHSRRRRPRRLKVGNIALIIGLIAVADIALYAVLYM